MTFDPIITKTLPKKLINIFILEKDYFSFSDHVTVSDLESICEPKSKLLVKCPNVGKFFINCVAGLIKTNQDI